MKVGLIVGRENTFPQPFIDTVNRKGNGEVTAEFCRLGGNAHTLVSQYRVIVDRMSHEVPYYRQYLKVAALRGTYVINDPFWWTADDKFFECALAEEIGVAVPKTVLLPNKSYVEGVTDESLRNLQFPVQWQTLVDYIGFPAFLKPSIGGGWKNVYKVDSLQELWDAFNQTGTLQMILQEGIEFETYARCICLGKTEINVIPYDPRAPFERRYVIEDSRSYFGDDLYERIIRDAQSLNHALGFDMNTVEFAVRGGIPYAIDFLNPAPDFDVFSIKERNFEWVLETLSDFVIEKARSGASLDLPYTWGPMTRSARTNSIPANSPAPGGAE